VTGNPDDHLGDVMAELARRLRVSRRPQTVEEQLGPVLHAAADTVEGVDAASITVSHRDTRVETLVGTESLVFELDQAQYDLDEGPCLDAVRGRPLNSVDDMTQERRWPRYAPVAAARGVRSQMAIELYADDRSIGGLNLYSRRSYAFGEETRHAAWLFATHAAFAMGRAGQVQEVQELHQALATRKVIGQAIGIVMERYALDEDRAFEFLIRVSRHSNIKLRDVARAISDKQEKGTRQRVIQRLSRP
jgi:GAF domain-containing protein